MARGPVTKHRTADKTARQPVNSATLAIEGIQGKQQMCYRYAPA